MRPLLLAAGIGLLLLLAVPFLSAIGRTPSNDRAWIPEQSRLPAVERDGSRITIRDVRAFRYAANGDATPGWTTRTPDLSDVERVWYVLVPLTPKLRAPAHSFVTFGLRNGPPIAISVEARREVGETYGVLAGMQRQFELMYVIGDEPDLIGKRLFVDRAESYLFPVRATPAAAQALFVELLTRAEGLRTRPEFYHTLLNNCTGNLVDAVNRMAPGTVPGALASLLPGYSDRVARDLGLLETGGTVDEARQAHRLAAAAVTGETDPARFAVQLRAALPPAAR